MDIRLARTFLEVLASGSLLAAAERLAVTQSAVSLRIKNLEQELGRQIFIRSKAGVTLTPAGQQFERFARSIIKTWEDARYQVAVPKGFEDTLIIATQYTLWPRFGLRWLNLLEAQLPEVALRVEVGTPDRLMGLLHGGVLDIAVMFTPQLRPGLMVERVIEDDLMLVSCDPAYEGKLDESYTYVDWGPDFAALHRMHFPDFETSRTSLSLGILALSYVITHKRAAYLPARAAGQYVRSGQLHICPNAPVFPYPAYAAWTSDLDPKLSKRALACLRQASKKASEDEHMYWDSMDTDGVAS